MSLKTILFAILAISLSIGLVACSDDDDDSPTEFNATQSDLNEATNELRLDLTGIEFGEASVGHDGGSEANATIRDVWSNLSSNTAPIEVGTIITKKTYDKDNMGDKVMPHKVAFAMIKREEGYDPANGNWEYVMMPYDADNDYNVNPFGLLPEVSNEAQRGKLANCIGCHIKAEGGDQLFTR